MKWIGQNIYDLASRFRNDVFLENISTGTIASGAHLGLDSNNKIVKAVDGGGDLTSIVAGTGLSGTSLTGPIPTLNVDASQTQITGVGTITTGVWNGTAIASAYLDSDTAHLSGTQTFSGTKTFSSTISGSIDGQAATVATIAGLAPNTATTQATQPAIESIGTDGDTLTILADELLMSNATADAPIIKLVNITDDDQASQLIFEKLRDDDAVATGQNIGEIWFRGQDSAQNTQNYGFVLGEIDVSTSGQESGKVSLGIANHDGGNGRGLILTGGSENDEVDATLGLGANSVVTIPGNIDLAGDIDVDGTLETDALTIGGAAVLAQATASAVGAVELATTGEADTGTDTARAVTPAGLKSHVDANARKCILRHHAFYLNDNPMVQNSLYFGGNLGHQPSNWNDPQAAGGVIGDTTSFTIAKGDENWGMVLPFDISKVEVQCSLQPQLGTSDDFTVAIYTGIRPNDSASALTLTLAAHQSIAFSSGSNRTMINDVSLTADLAKNTMIYVGVGSEDATDAKNGRGYLTVTVTER